MSENVIDVLLWDALAPKVLLDGVAEGMMLNANESIVRRLILDSLRYWVREMHVDGFRFDLASILSRDQESDTPFPQIGVPRPARRNCPIYDG